MEKNDILKYLPHSINEIPGSNEEVSTEGNNILESVSAALALISDRIYVRILDAKRLNQLLNVKKNDLRIRKGSFEISDDVDSDCSSGVGCGCSSGGIDEKNFRSKLKHFKEKCISLIDELKLVLDKNSHLMDFIASLEEETINNAPFGLNAAAAPFNPTSAAAPFNSTAAAASPRFNPLTFSFNPRPWYHQVYPTPNQPGGSRRAVSNHINRPYFQPVFVPGNQGMFKTRLCTHWQQTRVCPDGEQCHFAHGFNELRPYILHPRYRTEVCRTVRAGIYCPYGYRCQFRHH